MSFFSISISLFVLVFSVFSEAQPPARKDTAQQHFEQDFAQGEEQYLSERNPLEVASKTLEDFLQQEEGYPLYTFYTDYSLFLGRASIQLEGELTEEKLLLENEPYTSNKKVFKTYGTLTYSRAPDLEFHIILQVILSRQGEGARWTREKAPRRVAQWTESKIKLDAIRPAKWQSYRIDEETPGIHLTGPILEGLRFANFSAQMTVPNVEAWLITTRHMNREELVSYATNNPFEITCEYDSLNTLASSSVVMHYRSSNDKRVIRFTDSRNTNKLATSLNFDFLVFDEQWGPYLKIDSARIANIETEDLYECSDLTKYVNSVVRQAEIKVQD